MDHISVSHVNKLVINKNIFQANTFLLVIHVRKYSRITHIATLACGHTRDAVDIEWYVNSCLKEVFYHDSHGKLISGSLKALAMPLLSGQSCSLQDHMLELLHCRGQQSARTQWPRDRFRA